MNKVIAPGLRISPAFCNIILLYLEKKKMTIDYALYKNKLTEDTDLYAARALITSSAGLEAIADRIVEQGSTVTRTDCIAVLEGAVTAVQSLLLDGARVNFGGLFDLYPKIKGKFSSITDHYDPSRHQVDIGATPGSRVRKYVRENATVGKLETVLPQPLVLEFYDLGSDTTNTTITPGNIGTLKGARLSFDPNNAEEGIFIMDTASTATIQLNITQKNKPSELVFMVPAFAFESVYIEVRKHFTTDGDLRIGRLNYTLTKSI